MTPILINQVLNIRMLRADKAERAVLAARADEAKALAAVQLIESQLAAFDASFEARVSGFLAKTADGTRPESLHSARSFHADLARERDAIAVLIPQAWQLVDQARERTAMAQAAWAEALQAVDNFREFQSQELRKLVQAQERLAERDADELSIARAFRDAG